MSRKTYKPNFKARKEHRGNIITGIIVIVILLLILFFAYRWYTAYTNQEVETVQKDETTTPDEPEEDAAYINEVRYIGGIGYKEVYEEPFKKSDFYISNKDMWEEHPDIIPVVSETATDFMNKLLNTGYRKILDGKDAYVEDMVQYMDRDWIYNEDMVNNQSSVEYMSEYADYMIDNEVSMKGNFITDTSLVYEDGLLYVRGMVEYAVYSSKDESMPADGVEKTIMMEVALHRDAEDATQYDVVSWGEIGAESSEETNDSE